MIAQAAAISGGLWLSFGSKNAGPSPAPAQAYLVAFICWIILVAFATAVLTRLWDWTLFRLARPRPRIRQRE